MTAPVSQEGMFDYMPFQVVLDLLGKGCFRQVKGTHENAPTFAAPYRVINVTLPLTFSGLTTGKG